MENNNLAKHSLIKRENIDYHQLTLSLINEGIRINFLTPSKVEDIQSELMSVLSHMILQYTHNESNSVKTETAQGILQSIIYCLDLSLSSLPSFEDALEELSEKSLTSIHDRGLKLYIERMLLAKEQLEKAKSTALPNPIIAYNDTINAGFEDYFQNPDGRFEAHSSGAVIDYPLLTDDTSWTGLLYVERYLAGFILENQFCALYPVQGVNELIHGCAKKFKMPAGDLMNNIPELILRNSICCILLGFPADTLIIEKADCILLEAKLRLLSDIEIGALLNGAMNALFMELDIFNSPLSHYLQPFAGLFLPHLIQAVRKNSLKGAIVLDGKYQKEQKDIYISGVKLSDEKLRAVISEITECENGDRKADLIQSEIKNIEDLMEVFNSYCIFENEYSSIFDRMTDHELALLSLELVDASPFSEGISLSVEEFQLSENRVYWRNSLAQYLSHGDSSKYKRVAELAKELTTV